MADRNYYTRVTILDEFLAGQRAFEAGQRPGDCPHSPTDPESGFRSYYWLAGWWVAARPETGDAWRLHIRKADHGRFWSHLEPGR